jgi:hypothetical protein
MATLIQQATDVASSILKSGTQTDGVHINGQTSKEYSAQHEAENLLVNEIIRNPLMKSLPAELEGLSKHVRYEGSSQPSIPINWRFAESIAYVTLESKVQLKADHS